MKTILLTFLTTISFNVLAAGPCLADFNKLCPNVEKSKQNIVKCILANEAKVSPSCRKKAQVMKKRMANPSKNKSKSKNKKPAKTEKSN